MTGKGGSGARWGWMRFGAVFEGKEGIAEMKVAGWGEESAERFLSAQADPFTGVKGKKKSACSVRNDEQVGRAVMSGLKLFGLITSVTGCIRTSVTPEFVWSHNIRYGLYQDIRYT